MMYHRMLITSLKVVSDLLLAVVSVILVLITSIISVFNKLLEIGKKRMETVFDCVKR